MSKDFAEVEMEEFDRSEQVDFVNRSVKYFSENELFDNREFEQEVLKQPEIIESFESFKEEYSERNDIPPIEEEFEISKPAIKNTKRFIKSVIKLDKNFHVYVHGSRERIERGFDDEKGTHYYKLYFEEEH